MIAREQEELIYNNFVKVQYIGEWKDMIPDWREEYLKNQVFI